MDTTERMESRAYPRLAAAASESERRQFIQLTYLHVAFAVLAFAVVESLLLSWSGSRELARLMISGYSWLFVLMAFGGVSMVAERWARSGGSVGTQYFGLGDDVAEAILFVPLMHWVRLYGDPSDLQMAASITFLMAAGLTAIAFTSGADYSFLRGALCVGGMVAFGAIVASILYQTSNVLREYRTDQHVAPALALFAAMALLFWYVLRLVGWDQD